MRVLLSIAAVLICVLSQITSVRSSSSDPLPHDAGAGSAPLFQDVTENAGISFKHTGPGLQDKFQGTGAAWIDYDRDGDLDLYLTRRIGANVFYRNNGNGTFTDITGQLRLTDETHDGAGIVVADYNNDGWPDIYLANSDEDVLFRNKDGERFINVTISAGLGVNNDARGTTAAWGDFNQDGWLDLYVTNHEHLDRIEGKQRDVLYESNRNGTFTDVSHFLPFGQTDGYGFAGLWTDFDDDGDLDIFVVNDCPLGPRMTRLFRNDGAGGPGWQFSDISAESGAENCASGMGLAIGDYNRDGLFDFFYTNIGAPVLLRNDGDLLVLQTGQAKVNIGRLPDTGMKRWTWGANFFDYDLDGWEDLYVASGAFRQVSSIAPQANVLLRNESDGTFSDFSTGSGADDPDRSRTSIVGDYDGDGDLDIVVVNYEEPARLYRNENATDNHYFSVVLEGIVSNRDGVGARVRIRTEDNVYQYREIRSGSSVGGGDVVCAHFGTGSSALVTELLIRWPSGIVQAVMDLSCDQRVRIVEPAESNAAAVSEFSGERMDQEVVFSWRTSYESDLKNFQIQIRNGDVTIDGGLIAANGTSFRPHEYRYEAGALEPGIYVIRLLSSGGDGDQQVVEELNLEIPRNPHARFANIGSNPFSDATSFVVEVEKTQHVDVSVYDVRGHRVAHLLDRVVLTGHPVVLSFDGVGRAAGIYFLRARGFLFSIDRKVTLVR